MEELSNIVVEESNLRITSCVSFFTMISREPIFFDLQEPEAKLVWLFGVSYLRTASFTDFALNVEMLFSFLK